MSAQEPTSHRGGGSGGYLEHVFRHAARELFGIHVDEVTYRPLRSVGRVAVGAALALGVLTEVGPAEDGELGLAHPRPLGRSWPSSLAHINGPQLSGLWSPHCVGVSVPCPHHGSSEVVVARCCVQAQEVSSRDTPYHGEGRLCV